MDYLDTGVLVKLYFPEINSEQVSRFFEKKGTSIPITNLHILEWENAINLKLFRKEINTKEVALLRKDFESDLSEGVLELKIVSGSESLKIAAELSRKHTHKLGVRSLDILHVAQAISLKVKEFYSLDMKQIALAKAARLKVVKPLA
ncbi:type II toxin-antitoxin system VapC family toxin [Leptospira sanjuanensis]|uniref:type II toxin-antitoxin system VapC family toxin n=1 Tax=Leptospira sanjuanensis TaxID=2879643 RepID=UPI001EE97263|nr:PIN domain-containing protein [Leptospira sanjuanensis]MCG6168815.1 type II toxin-antitoxin system VapC family toxin [Leptospira sanjuanensis]